ncbi:hypothetical protein EAI99_09220 [Alistipes onderdonkii]|nr:hypothetical protein EAI99_09220 [Alistipes onderdonkii]
MNIVRNEFSHCRLPFPAGLWQTAKRIPPDRLAGRDAFQDAAFRVVFRGVRAIRAVCPAVLCAAVHVGMLCAAELCTFRDVVIRVAAFRIVAFSVTRSGL